MSSSVSLEYLNLLFADGKTGITAEGGLYETFINATGAISIKGTVVATSTTIDDAVMVSSANNTMSMGVVYESGVAVGQRVKVVTYGKAQVLLKNDQPATRGYWAGTADVAGRMYQIISPGGTEHNREIGHSLETKQEGTNVLSLVQLHFN